MSSFSWLADRKKQADLEAAQKGKRQIPFASNTIGSRFMGMTGMGEDGQFQKNMPVAMVPTTNGQRMIHEGEGVIQNADGSTTVVPQKDLARIQKVAGTKGYARGGTYTPQITTLENLDWSTLFSRVDQSRPAGASGAGTFSNSKNPIFSNIDKRKQNIVDQFRPIVASPTIAAAPILRSTPAGTTVANPATVTKPSDYNPATMSGIPDAQLTATQYQQKYGQKVGPMSEPIDTSAEPTAPVSAHQAGAPTGPTDNQAVTEPPAPPTSLETQARDAGLQGIMDILNGGSTASQLAGRRAINEAKGTAAVDQQVLAQQNAQQGLDENVSASRMAQGRAEGAANVGDIEAKALIAQRTAQENAAQTLATQGLAGQRFEQDKVQYGDSKAWKDFEYTAEYGSDADVIAAYKTATGKDLDPAAVAEVRGYARTKRSQDLTAGENANILSGQAVTGNQQQLISSTASMLTSWGQLPANASKAWNDPTVSPYLGNYYKSLTGKDADPADPAYQEWAQSAWRVATDKTLSNQFDAMVYSIDSSSTLPADTKAKLKGLLFSAPDMIEGIEFDPATGLFKAKETESVTTPTGAAQVGKRITPEVAATATNWLPTNSGVNFANLPEDLAVGKVLNVGGQTYIANCTGPLAGTYSAGNPQIEYIKVTDINGDTKRIWSNGKIE